jgi:nucleoside-diphosphate-sugar epimerase
VGGAVARQLLGEGHRVRALVRDPEKAQALAAAGATLVKGDLSDAARMQEAMEGAAGVFHIAGWYKLGTADKEQGRIVNVEGTHNVLTAMRGARVPKGVYTSSLAVFGNTAGKLVDESFRMDGPWLSEYDRTKWQAHYEVADPMMKAGLPLVIVQPGLVYGPGDTSSVRAMLVSYLKGELKRIPAVTAYCWGHIDDMARAHVLAMERGRAGESYITAGPPHTVVEALAIAERLTGIKAPAKHASPRAIRFAAALMSVVKKFKEVDEAMDPETLRVLAGNTYLGTSAKAERELGFKARSLEEGLGPVLSHERAELAAGARVSAPTLP